MPLWLLTDFTRCAASRRGYQDYLLTRKCARLMPLWLLTDFTRCAASRRGYQDYLLIIGVIVLIADLVYFGARLGGGPQAPGPLTNVAA